MKIQAAYHAERQAGARARQICIWCLWRPAGRRHALCGDCRRAAAKASRERYAELRRLRRCTRCGAPSGGAYLCADHAAARNARRAEGVWT